MEAFTVHQGLCALLERDDVDTDQIIPKQFLKRTDRDSYGEACFYDWRYQQDGSPAPGFELNDPAYQGASVLVAGRNFGCGSSREHAAWALWGYGLRVVIAPSFGDIFQTNALQNGLLPVVVRPSDYDALAERIGSRDGYRLTVDLVEQQLRDDDGWVIPFVAQPFWRECLLSGLDPIAMALAESEAITDFEAQRSLLLPSNAEIGASR